MNLTDGHKKTIVAILAALILTTIFGAGVIASGLRDRAKVSSPVAFGLPKSPETLGLSFAFDSMVLGERVQPTWRANHLFYPPGTPGVNSLESERFRIVWGDTGSFDIEQARGNLRNLEDQWQLFTGILEMPPPDQSTHPELRDGNRYKLNIYVGGSGLPLHTSDGYFLWFKEPEGFASLNIGASGLRVDPPSWVNPHELAHAFQVHAGGGFVDNPPMGFWWEAHANWMREQYLTSPLYPEAVSGIAREYPVNATFHLAHGRHYYDHWTVFQYLAENPDDLPGLGGPGIVADLWKHSEPGEYIYDALERLAPVSAQDVLAYHARRVATYDFALRDQYRRIEADWDTDPTYAQGKLTPLRPQVDRPGVWLADPSMWPQQGGYNVVRLEPLLDRTNVTARVTGLVDPTRGSGWRASLVAVAADGSTRYSCLCSGDGEPIELDVGADDTEHFLVVAATPRLEPVWETPQQPYRSAAKAQFPWEVTLDGAVPAFERASAPGSGGPHPNGGGWVASTATVSPRAWIGPDAQVLGRARVEGGRVEGRARVMDDAMVRGEAVVRDHAIVRGRAIVEDRARVADWAVVEEQAVIGDSAEVREHGIVTGNRRVVGSAVVKGRARAWADPGSIVEGMAVLDGDFAAGVGADEGVQFGWLRSQTDADTAPPTRGLIAHYPFDRPHPYGAVDRLGSMDSIARGDPGWLEMLGGRDGVLSFDGADDYLSLDPLVVDREALSFALWLAPRPAAREQVGTAFGSLPDRRLALELDSTQRLVLRLQANGDLFELKDPAPTTADGWTHIAVALGEGRLSLWRDGREIAASETTLTGEDLRPPDGSSAVFVPRYAFVGRGATPERAFAGWIDDIRFYFRVLDADAMIELAVGPQPGLIARYPLDESAGQIARDISGRSLHGRIAGAAWDGGALAFDGVDDELRVPVRGGRERTLAAWIRPNTSDATDLIESVIDNDVPGEYGSGWGLAGGSFRVLLDDLFWDPGVSARLTDWQHVALAFDGTSARFYVDGDLKASTSYTAGDVSEATYRVGRSNANDLFYDGQIRDLRIYDRALSDDQVAAVVAGRAPLPTPTWEPVPSAIPGATLTATPTVTRTATPIAPTDPTRGPTPTVTPTAPSDPTPVHDERVWLPWVNKP